MPWSDDRYPVSMKNLRPRVRHKAIEIASALLASGRPEGPAIRIAIWSAKRWGAAHSVRRVSVTFRAASVVLGRNQGRCSAGISRVNTRRPRLKPIRGGVTVAMTSAGVAAFHTTRSAGLPGAMP